MNDVTTAVSGILIGALVFLACYIGGAVLLGLATYNDAKSRLNESPAMWGVLVGLLGCIPGIIYLCTRNNALNRLIACPSCGWGMTLGSPACPRCGVQNSYAQHLYDPQTKGLRHKATVMLVWGLVLIVVGIIAYVVIMLTSFMAVAESRIYFN